MPRSEERKPNDRTNDLYRSRLIRRALILSGTIFVGLGMLGILIPVLPTTPFLLLAAACYARSSERFYSWLLNHRWFGKQVRTYREGKGISRRAKAISISLLWLTILFSTLFIVHPLSAKIILMGIAAGVTLYLLSLPTLRE